MTADIFRFLLEHRSSEELVITAPLLWSLAFAAGAEFTVPSAS